MHMYRHSIVAAQSNVYALAVPVTRPFVPSNYRLPTRLSIRRHSTPSNCGECTSESHAPAFVYTMLSCCKTLDGLAILRNFTRADLRSSPNAKLAADQARLDRLQAQLLARYRNDDPVDRIDLRECFPPGYRLPIRAGPAAALTRAGPSQHLNALQPLELQMQADA